MKGSTIVTGFAVSYFGLVLLRDGTLGQLVQRGSDFIQTGVRGLRPLTRIG